MLGLTGPVAGGKTFLLELFREAGVVTIETDAVYADLVSPGKPLLEPLGGAFPGVIRADGSLDRAALAEIVFRDQRQLQRLNEITHPALGRAVAALAHEYLAAGACQLVIEAAVLFGIGADALCDEVWFVDAPREERVRRLMTTRAWAEDRARAVVDAQGEMAEIRRACGRHVDGSSSADALRRLVREWLAVG